MILMESWRLLRQVAEQLMDPFGDDDDDFEINGILDSNLEVGQLLVAMSRSYCTVTRYGFIPGGMFVCLSVCLSVC